MPRSRTRSSTICCATGSARSSLPCLACTGAIAASATLRDAALVLQRLPRRADGQHAHVAAEVPLHVDHRGVRLVRQQRGGRDHSTDDIAADRSCVIHTRLSSPRKPPMMPAVSRPPPDGSMDTAIFCGRPSYTVTDQRAAAPGTQSAFGGLRVALRERVPVPDVGRLLHVRPPRQQLLPVARRDLRVRQRVAVASPSGSGPNFLRVRDGRQVHDLPPAAVLQPPFLARRRRRSRPDASGS